MPPKKGEPKKGPAYKAPTPLKDIVPPEVKQPPRQPKPLRVPESFPEPVRNEQTLPPLFEEWPSEEAVKAHDFGLQAEVAFEDPAHEEIRAEFGGGEEVKWMRLGEMVPDVEAKGEEGRVESAQEVESLRNIERKEEEGEAELCVVQTFTRAETEEEMGRRLQEEAERAEKAAKDKKKAGKKEEPREEGPAQVSEVRMVDVVTEKHIAGMARWIGSQLQLIKLRGLLDVNTGEPVWRKIHPQDNGVPQLTRSGRYWVKLLHMGRYVKVEVDDRVPLDGQSRLLFPQSANPAEQWAGIVTKALLKFLVVGRMQEVVGSGLIVYALTGMLSETVPLEGFEGWELLEELLGNEHYSRKDVVVGCYATREKSFRRAREVKEEGAGEEETGLMSGFSYGVGDYFDNDQFNMVFSQEKSEREMRLKHEYNELCKVSISNKTREEKLEYRRKKKELKEKLGAEEKKRMELISKAPLRHRFLKLLAPLALNCEYGEREILLAKKCVLNRLSQPPNYDMPADKEEKDSKSIQSLSHTVIKYKEEAELFPNIHDFSALPHVLPLQERPEQGVWAQSHDVLAYLDALQLMYDPTSFPHKAIQLVHSTRPAAFTHDPSKEVLVVEKPQQEEEGPVGVKLLFGFAQQPSPSDLMSPYSLLQKFDFDAFRATAEVVRLQKHTSSKLLSLPNQNTVYRLYTASKGNYGYWISADSSFKLLSVADYLTEFEGYSKKVVSCEYPPIEAATYFPLLRLRLAQQTGTNRLLFKLTGLPEDLAPHLNLRVVVSEEGQERSLTAQEAEGVIERRAEKVLLGSDYSRLLVEEGREYYLILEAQGRENIPEGAVELTILSKEEGLTVEQREQVEGVKHVERYLPNKYGLICRERVYCNADTAASLTFRLADFEEGQPAAGKAAKKGGKEEGGVEIVDKPFSGQRSVLLSVKNKDKVLYEAAGVNEITVPNLKFLSTKANPDQQYYIEFSFDLRRWPEAAVRSEETDKICWVAEVQAEDSIALVRDTRQEDREKATRKSWEDAQPGRAERAAKARKKYLAEVKKRRGEALTEEEEQLISAPRLTRRQQMEELAKNDDKKGKGAKKDDKKAGKDAKKDEPAEEKPKARPAPRSHDNFTNELRAFLQMLEQKEYLHEQLGAGETARIRSGEELRAIQEGALMAGENRVGKLVRNVERRETMKLRERDRKETVKIFYSEAQGDFKLKYDQYSEYRAQDAQQDSARQEKERQVAEVVAQDKPALSEADLRKLIGEYQEMQGHNPALVAVADMVRKNIRVSSVSQRVAAALAAWEVDELKAITQEMSEERVEGVEEDLVKQMAEMLEEAGKNPALVAEKQAEAKKAKKGGKK